MKHFIAILLLLSAWSAIALTQDSAKVDKYAFPPLPQELKHADSLLAAGDSANGLAELRQISTSANDEVKARAKYCIADFYGNKMRGVVDKEYSDKLNMAKSTIESVDALRYSVKMKALFNAFAFKEYQELIDEYPDSYIIPKAILGAFFTAPNAAEKLRIMKAYKDKPFNNETKRDVYFCLASAYKDTKDFEGAIGIWKESINTFPNDRFYCADALFHIAEYTRGDGQLDAYWEVIKKYPDQETYALMSYDEISGIYGSAGNIDKGVEISLQAIEKYKHHTSIPSRLYAIYSAYQDARKYGKADDIKKRILREYPDSKEAQNLGAD